MSRRDTQPTNRGLLLTLSAVAVLLTVTLALIAQASGSALAWALAAASLAAAGSVGITFGATFIRRRMDQWIEQRRAAEARLQAQWEQAELEPPRWMRRRWRRQLMRAERAASKEERAEREQVARKEEWAARTLEEREWALWALQQLVRDQERSVGEQQLVRELRQTRPEWAQLERERLEREESREPPSLLRRLSLLGSRARLERVELRARLELLEQAYLGLLEQVELVLRERPPRVEELEERAELRAQARELRRLAWASAKGEEEHSA